MSKDLVENKTSIELLNDLNTKLENNWKIGDILFDVQHRDYYRLVDVDDEGVICDRKKWGEWEWDEHDREKYPKSGHHSFEYIKSYVKIDVKHITDIPAWEKEQQQLALQDYSKEDEVSDSTELVTFNKEFYTSMKALAKSKKEKFEVMQAVLEKKRNELSNYVNKFKKVIERVMLVIGQIELYLGINEDIVQLQRGETSEQPLTLRQQMLFMDEEYGSTRDDGLDFNNIEEFDNWLLEDEHYKTMLPEEKGIVIFRVRREDKHYSDDPIANGFANIPNTYTYFLIRNGDNIYRIWAKIKVKDRLFPKREELQELMEEVEEKGSSWDKEKLEGKLFSYRQNLLLVKGLMDRTQIFAPMKEGVDVFKVETWDDNINFVYDEEDAILPDGKKSFDDWQTDLNSKLVRGSRVYFDGFPYGELYEDGWGYDPTRFAMRPPERPPRGVYSIEHTEQVKDSWHRDKTNEALCCFFKSDDPVYGNWGWESRERKNRTKFYLYREDEFILNYDLITFEDVDYYIRNRYERKNYLKILPILRRIRRARKEELTWEQEFVKSMAGRKGVSEQLVWECVEWWKNKVIWKRPLTKDDDKAWRMIEKRLKTIINTKYGVKSRG